MGRFRRLFAPLIRYLRRLGVGVLFAVVMAPIMGCSNTKTIQWHEQVKLSDGKVIVVERTQTYRAVSGDYQSGWLLSKASIRAAMPTTPSTHVEWEGPLEPLAIDMTRDGTVYLVTIVLTQQGARAYSPKDGAHVAFKYLGDNRWQRIPRGMVPKNLRVNLLVSVDFDQKYSGHTISLPLKKKLDSDPRIAPEFRGWNEKYYF